MPWHSTITSSFHDNALSALPQNQARLFDGSPIWLLTKMQDVKEVLQDNRLSKVRVVVMG